MKFLHTADLHFRRERFDEAKASFDVLKEAARTVEFIAISGDTWDGPVQNTAGSRFPEFISMIQSLADLAPVAIIYGTPSHDTEGSLDVFNSIESRYGITILQPGTAYYFGGMAGDFYYPTIRKHSIPGRDKALLFGVPEPQKKWLLAEAGATGGETADEAVQGSMRALLLGLGGIRKTLPELPCVLLYHGQVVGARTSTGYEASSSIAVTKMDMAYVGADYYALGDIHEPQQIPGLPAYYPGSIYPCNFGETHRAGCNVVDISGSRVTIERVEFPHPQNMKLKTTAAAPTAPDADVYGKKVWIEITVSKEEAAKIDCDAILSKILGDGAMDGSRVTLDIIPTETVRAGAIAEKKSLRDKVLVWGENSATPITESILAKADDLEQHAKSIGVAISGAHIRIDKLILRGAIGLWEVSKKDEVVLDLESYGTGVFALVAGNGEGKTTIIENLHPWPQLLTRPGTLRNHFRLRDSERDLYFTDTATGWKYRARILINAAVASGATEYYLYCDKGSGYEPLPGINGRLEPYAVEVSRLFGSLSLYLRTAFLTQRPTKDAPDLAEATKGDRKALFAELSGLDYLAGHSAIAKQKADGKEIEVNNRKILLGTMDSLDNDIEEVQGKIEMLSERIDNLTSNISAIKELGRASKLTVESLRAKVATYDTLIAARASLANKIELLIRDKATAESSMTRYKAAASNLVPLRGRILQSEILTDKIGEMKSAKASLASIEQMEMVQYRKAVEKYNGERQKLVNESNALGASILGLSNQISMYKKQLDEPISDKCPACGQALPESSMERFHEHRASIEKSKEDAELSLAGLQGTQNGVKACIASLPVPQAPEARKFEKEDELAAAMKALSALQVAEARSEYAVSLQADAKMSELASHMEEIQSRIAESESDLLRADTILENEWSGDIKADLEQAIRRHDGLKDEYTALVADKSGSEAFIATFRGTLEKLEASVATREVLLAEQEVDAQELAEWRTLETACGKDGIQALELDALAPGIATIANNLLSAAYGNRYQIEFRTTRIAGKGSKSKQIEDFLIYIVNQETGTEKELSVLSGGEAVWIRRAIDDAFAAIRSRNLGTQFLTTIMDEADGALDPSARMAYYRMLLAAHAESGRFQSILISHSTEIQSMAEVIRVADLPSRAA